MDARQQHRDPQRGAETEVGDAAARGQEPHDREQGHDRDRGDERHRVEAGVVEHPDREQGADVVHDGERQEEDPQAGGVLRADEREGAEQEGRVGRDDDAPGIRFAAREVEEHEDERGDDESRERRRHRDDRARAVGQLADRELALDLETDEEEEQGHQPLVHDRMRGERH